MPSFLSQPDRERIIASSYVRVMYAWSKITIFVACPWRKWQRRTKWSSIDLERTWAQRDSAEKHSKFRPSSTRSWTQGVWFLHVNRFNIEYYTFILVLSSKWERQLIILRITTFYAYTRLSLCAYRSQRFLTSSLYCPRLCPESTTTTWTPPPIPLDK